MMKRKQQQIIICPECHGSGSVIRLEFKGHSEGTHHFEIGCQLCGGTGRMLQTIYEELNKLGEKPVGFKG